MSTTTVVDVHLEETALELCAELVKQGKTFRCEKTPQGWTIEVLL